MDGTRARCSILQGSLFSGLLSCLTVLAPMIALHFWYFFIFPNVYFLLPNPFASNMPGDIALLLLGLLPPALVCILVAFLANLAIPVARNEWKAMLCAIPATLYYFYLYVFPFFWGGIMGRLYPNDTPDAWMYDLRNGIEFLPVWMLVFVLMSSAAWAGSRLEGRLETQ